MNINKLSKKVVFEITSACNLKCRHCFYQNGSDFFTKQFINKHKAFRLIREFKKGGIEKLVLTGGEPTIHPDFIEIAKYAKQKLPKVTLCTNGVIKSNKMKRVLLVLGFDTYTLSIDSHLPSGHDKFRGAPGAFKETLSFAKTLTRNGKNLSIHISLHENNLKHIQKTIKFCRQFNSEIIIGSIYYEKLNFNDKLVNSYQAKLKDFKKSYLKDTSVTLVGFNKYCKYKNCQDLKNVFTINSKGQLISCYWGKNGGKVIKNYAQITYEDFR